MTARDPEILDADIGTALTNMIILVRRPGVQHDHPGKEAGGIDLLLWAMVFTCHAVESTMLWQPLMNQPT